VPVIHARPPTRGLIAATSPTVVRASMRPRRGLAEAVLADLHGWPGLVTAIQRIFPKSEIWLWQQEHLRMQGRSVVSEITGLPPAALNLPRQDVNSSAALGVDAPLFTAEETARLDAAYVSDLNKLRTPQPHLRWLTEDQQVDA